MFHPQRGVVGVTNRFHLNGSLVVDKYKKTAFLAVKRIVTTPIIHSGKSGKWAWVWLWK